MCEMAGEAHRLQVHTVAEGKGMNFLDTIRNNDCLEALYSGESTVAYFLHILWDDGILASCYQYFRASLHDGIALVWAAIAWIVWRYDDLLQCATTCKSEGIDFCHSAGDRNAAQLFTFSESACVDGLQSLIEHHLLQVSTFGKGLYANLL